MIDSSLARIALEEVITLSLPPPQKKVKQELLFIYFFLLLSFLRTPRWGGGGEEGVQFGAFPVLQCFLIRHRRNFIKIESDIIRGRHAIHVKNNNKNINNNNFKKSQAVNTSTFIQRGFKNGKKKKPNFVAFICVTGVREALCDKPVNHFRVMIHLTSRHGVYFLSAMAPDNRNRWD